MKNFNPRAFPSGNVTVKLLCFFLLSSSISGAQNYRNELAYIEDFGKNELFVKETLAEYSKAVMQANSERRSATTLKQLYIKLENLNAILLKNDKGFKGDVRLRDALIKMNETTLKLFKNNTLVLNDYEKTKLLSIKELESLFNQKEFDLKNYYAQVAHYEKSKSDFGINYDVRIRFLDGENVFEYNAYQNLYFYIMNVIDEKLMYLITQNKFYEAIECMNYLVTKGDELVAKNIETKFDYDNFSLVKANKDLAAFLASQRKSIFPHFEHFMTVYNTFQKFKKTAEQNPTSVSDEVYNHNVRNYNEVKNNFYAVFNFIQTKKKNMIDNFYILNSRFLMNTSKFENNYERYAEVD